MKQNNIKTWLSAIAVGVLVVLLMTTCEPSQRKIEKKHAKYVSSMPDVKLRKGKHSSNAEKLADVIAWEMATDIDSLIRGLTTPQTKYHLNKMYCNTAVTTAIRDALNKTEFKDLYGIDFFADANLSVFQSGAHFLKYLEKQNPDAYNVATITINFNELTEKDYEKMTPGSVIVYRGNYVNSNNGKTIKPYSHTQIVGGTGFSDDTKGEDDDGNNPGGTKFMPSRRGEKVTINAYNDCFRYAGDNISIYNNRDDVNMTDVVVVDMRKYLQAMMQNTK